MDAEATKLRIDVYPEPSMITKQEPTDTMFAQSSPSKSKNRDKEKGRGKGKDKDPEIIDLDEFEFNPPDSAPSSSKTLPSETSMISCLFSNLQSSSYYHLITMFRNTRHSIDLHGQWCRNGPRTCTQNAFIWSL